MAYVGELISIGVAFSWTATALLSEYGSKRLGNLTLNVLRIGMSLLFPIVLFLIVTGSPLPPFVTIEAGGWMFLSGIVGYAVGDFCLFQCYIIIGSRYGQLFMTLAPLTAALLAWVALGQQMSAVGILAMIVTLSGIAISILGRDANHKVSMRLPLNGVLFAVAAAICQGIGLVLSKVGMDYYEEPSSSAWLVPFSANFIRCVAGIIGFGLMLYFRDGVRPLCDALHDSKGMAVATATTIFGPFVGVGFSLMAVQYASAGVASTLMALTPIMIILPSYWLFKQKITARAVVGAVISVIGVSLFFLG